MPSVTINLRKVELTNDEEYTVYVDHGLYFPANAVITKGSFTFTIGVSKTATMLLKSFNINDANESGNQIGYDDFYGNREEGLYAWKEANSGNGYRITFSHDFAVVNKNPSSVFGGSTISLTIRVDFGDSSARVYANECTLTFDYATPSISAPTITQFNFDYNSNSFNIKWNHSAVSGGASVSSVQYTIYYRDTTILDDDPWYSVSVGNNTQYALNRWFTAAGSDVTATIFIRATYSGLSAQDSSQVSCVTIWPKIRWTDGDAKGSIRVERRGNKLYVEWNPAEIVDGSAEITYHLFQGGADGFMGSTKNTYMLISPKKYNEEVSYFIEATFSFEDSHPNIWSKTAYISIPSQVSYTVKCYLTVDGKNQWQDCIVKYHDGSGWVESVVKYCQDGTNFIECCF